MAQKQKKVVFSKNHYVEESSFPSGKLETNEDLGYQELQAVDFTNPATYQNSSYMPTVSSPQKNWASLPTKKMTKTFTNQNHQKMLPSLKASKSLSSFNQPGQMGSTFSNMNTNTLNQPFKVQLRRKFEEERQKRMSQQMAAISNDLFLKYFDTTNSHITRIPEFPSRFTSVPFLKYGPQQMKAIEKKENQTARQSGQTQTQLKSFKSKQGFDSQNNSQVALIAHPPPDFKDHKIKSQNDYYLPRIKDGMPTTVKNVAFLHSHNIGKKINQSIELENNSLRNLNNSYEKENSQHNSQQDLKIVNESPLRKKPRNTYNIGKELSLPFFKTELVYPPEITIQTPKYPPASFVNSEQVIDDKPQSIDLQKLNAFNHKLPAELALNKGYESARRHEKKSGNPYKKTMNISHSVDNITRDSLGEETAAKDKQLNTSNKDLLQLTQPPQNLKNNVILDKNNLKVRKGLINSLRRVDDRTISYHKAKSHLWSMTRNYLYQHFEKQDNSRAVVFPSYNKKGECTNRDSLLDISFHSVYSKQFFY